MILYPTDIYKRAGILVLACCLCFAGPACAAPEFIPVVESPGASGSDDPNLENFEIGAIENLSGRIAFSATVDGSDRIYLLDLDSRKLRAFVNGPGNNTYPAWSPHGTRLSFTSDRDGNKEIYLADWEGLGLARLTRNSVSDDNASWSPDGSQLVYFSASGNDSKEGDTNLFLLKLADGASRRLTSLKGRNTTPQIAPAGSQVAFSTNRFWPGWDICFWNPASGTEDCPLKGRIESFCRPAWSPSGQELAYSAGVGDSIDMAIMKVSDRSKTTVTSLPLREYDGAWSPSGKQLLFAAENGQKNIFNLYLLDLAGKELSPLLKSPYSLRFPSWTAVTTLQLESQRVAQTQFQEDQAALTPTALAASDGFQPSATPTAQGSTPVSGQ